MDLDALVLREGDEVAAYGRLVMDDSGTWLDPPLPVPAMFRLNPPVAKPSGSAVRLRGADLDAVEHRYERNGVVEGWATVTGLWRGGEVDVTGQSQPIRLPGGQQPRWRDPPCPAPAGGWPQGPSDLNLGVVAGDVGRSSVVVTMTTFRPSDTQAVLVVAAADVAAVEAGLRPWLGKRLCVIASRHSRLELDETSRSLRAAGMSGRCMRWAKPQMSSGSRSSKRTWPGCCLRSWPGIAARRPGSSRSTLGFCPSESPPTALKRRLTRDVNLGRRVVAVLNGARQGTRLHR